MHFYDCIIEYCIILLFIIIPVRSYSQLQTTNWVFGDSAGISFQYDKIEPIANSAIRASEGCSSISDNQGNLLFYTNGETVWDATHTPMPNGKNLNGDISASESSLIIQKPGNDFRYYVFTVDNMAQSNGLQYSIVNMQKNSGYGDIVDKNNMLLQPVTEKLAAVKHNNGTDIWVAVHEWGSDAFYAYLLTENGITDTVKSNAGDIHFKDNNDRNTPAAGCMKFSPNGKWLALSFSPLPEHKSQIFSFNDATGIIDSPVTFPPKNSYPFFLWPYGIAFSPNSKKLYLGTDTIIYQLDMEHLPGDTTQFKNSATIIRKNKYQSAFYGFSSLQLAPNGKIYVANSDYDQNIEELDGNSFLDVIRSPNKDGAKCDYKYQGLELKHGKTTLGFPNFVASRLKSPAIYFDDMCKGEKTKFTLSRNTDPDSIIWHFNDNNTSSDDANKGLKAEHVFSRPDTFQVKSVLYTGNTADTLRQPVIIRDNPKVNLGPDTTLCEDSAMIINAKPHNTKNLGTGKKAECEYLWKTGEQNIKTDTSHIQITDKNIYSVEVSSYYGCRDKDTIDIDTAPNPGFTLGQDTTLCKNDTLTLETRFDSGDFLWQDSSKQTTYKVSSPGTYFLRYKNYAGCSNSDTITTKYLSPPEIRLHDTVVCEGDSVIKSIKDTTYTTMWRGEQKGKSDTIYQPGKYKAKASNKCGGDTDTFKVHHISPPEININDTVMSKGEKLILTIPDTTYTIIWQNEKNGPSYTIDKAGKYRVRATNQCGIHSDTFKVNYKDITIPDVITPNQDNKNDTFIIPRASDIENELWIYNRWGDLIFHTKNYDNSWPSKPPSGSTYYYIFKDISNSKTYKGFLHIFQ